MSTIFIIHTRLDSLQTGKQQFIDRIEVYRDFLKKSKFFESELFLFTWTSDTKLQSNSTNVNYFKSKKISELATNLHELKTQISKSKNPILVLGDNYWSWLIVFWLKFSLKKPLPTQISVHNSPDFKEFRNYFSKILRKLWLRITFRFADSIRLVNFDQLSVIPRDIRKKCFVSPIIYDIPEDISHVNSKIIGFSGRIHSERGLDEWLNIIEKTTDKCGPVRVQILGEGNDSQYFLNKLYSISKISVSYSGYLLGKEYFSTLNTIGVLLSCAENETYGVSIRQAACLGIPVIARRNTKTQELSHKYPSLFYVYDSSSFAVELLSNILNGTGSINISELNELRKDMLVDRESSIGKIIDSWLGLSNKY